MRTLTSKAAVLLALYWPMQATATETSFAQLIAELDSLRDQHGVAGFALTLVSGRDGVKSGYGGLADRERKTSVSADTLFRIGSITKTFNALAIMMLVEEGRLDLDTPVREIIDEPPFRNAWAETYPLRAIHLLEQSSGLLDLTREEFDHNEPFPTLEAAFAWRPQARVAQWPPGWHHVYSNANAGLAGLVIERVSGQDYADFISERLLQPLGMRTASLVDDERTRKQLATGYDTDGRTTIPYWHMIFPPLGAINATPQEMAALIELFLRNGKLGSDRVLAASSIARMERPASTLAARQGLTYGYSAGLDQSLHGGFLWYGHGGDGDGYLSRFGYNRACDCGYFLTINAFNHEAIHPMRERVQDYLTRGLPASKPTPAGVDTDELQRLTGDYVAVTRRFDWQTPAELDADRLQIMIEDGALYTRSENGRRLLVPVTTRLFRRAEQPVATMAFIEQDGDIFLQGEFGNYRRIKTP
jgi:CubicO group peptidase (beta-lactamase class C family)